MHRPVGLKEAALDSPSFRATIVHFSEQVEAVERWLDNFIKSTVKLTHEVAALENLINGFITATAPPVQLSEAIIDHDYTLLAIRRYGEGAKDFWNSTIGGLKKMEVTMVEPVKIFLQTDLRVFKVLSEPASVLLVLADQAGCPSPTRAIAKATR